jgi:hypothetical protein
VVGSGNHHQIIGCHRMASPNSSQTCLGSVLQSFANDQASLVDMTWHNQTPTSTQCLSCCVCNLSILYLSTYCIEEQPLAFICLSSRVLASGKDQQTVDFAAGPAWVAQGGALAPAWQGRAPWHYRPLVSNLIAHARWFKPSTGACGSFMHSVTLAHARLASNH